MLRLLLVIMLVNGLVPSLWETLELAVHYTTTGHIAHLEPGETDLADGVREHGCGPIAHHCGCCPSQSVIPVLGHQVVLLADESDEPIFGSEQKTVAGTSRRLLRPPIAA